MSKYKYEEKYTEYESFSLRNEFELAKNYLLLDDQHANDEVFSAIDEIYHWFCVKTDEVEKLLKENNRLREGTSDDPLVAILQKAGRFLYKDNSKRYITATYNVLSRNGIKDIDALSKLSIVKAAGYRNATSNVLSIIATAQEMLKTNA